MLNALKRKTQNVPLPAKAASAYAVSSILQKGIAFLTLPLFTRLLTTEQYGQFTIYLSWESIVCIFITLNLAYGSFAPAMAKFESERDAYIASVEGICLALAAIFVAVYLSFADLWNMLFDLPTPLIIVMVLEIVGQYGIALWCGKKQFEYKYKGVVALNLANAAIAPLVALLLVLNTNEKGYAYILGIAITNIVLGGAVFVFNLVQGRRVFEKRFWKYALAFNIPLLAYYLSQVVFNQSDRLMINAIVGPDAAALYGVAYNIAMVLTFLLNAINNSYIPWLYGKIKVGAQSENKPVATAIAGLLAALVLMVDWLAPELVFILGGSRYAKAAYVIPPIAMSLLLLFYAQLFINVEFYYEQKRHLVFASIGAAVLNILLNAWLIPIFGFVAAGYTTFASYIVFAGSNYLALKQTLSIQGKAQDAYDLHQLLAILGVFVVLGFVGMALYPYVLLRAIALAALAVVGLIRRKQIMTLVEKIR
ncbi:lipopolysaccharide biosynthesis protein [Curtanaerobium respiraculi]|uniref:lipopolysaccharide biosynthesis protein n=1 Tax=Curtanaerobium respiraculi TaxID=2949669 RepID=UPI0024B3A21F|nr:oligosaccharide flippase family protein [Curtanaerobium respiraculi]